MESNQSKQNRNRNQQQHRSNWKPRDNKDKPLNTLGDLYDLKKMCREKGYKLKD